MDELRSRLSGLPGFGELLGCLQPEEFFLVGGALRDWRLGRAIKDIDLAMAGDPTPLARNFARRCAGSWFWLDQARKQSRVVVKTPGNLFSYDFSPLRAADIHADLADRDFTLNAMAVPLSGDRWTLLDPLGGLQDIAGRRLKHCNPACFQDDPLRVLRGVRFALRYNFSLAPATRALMLSGSSALADIPGERIHAELSAVLNFPGSAELPGLLSDLELCLPLFGAQPGEASRRRTALRLQQLESRAAGASAGVASLAEETFASGFSRLALLKLFLLISAVQGRAGLPAIAERLALGRRATTALAGLFLLRQIPVCPVQKRAQRLWLDDLPGDPQVSLCWLLLAEPASVASALHLERLSPDLVATGPGELPKPLLSAGELLQKLGIKPGPELGAAFAELRRMEISGLVSSPGQAEKQLAEWARKSIDKDRGAP